MTTKEIDAFLSLIDYVSVTTTQCNWRDGYMRRVRS